MSHIFPISYLFFPTELDTKLPKSSSQTSFEQTQFTVDSEIVVSDSSTFARISKIDTHYVQQQSLMFASWGQVFNPNNY